MEVLVVNGEYCKTAFIGHAIMDADIFISLTHFKGHEATGFGGALKNIGMGCGSRAGKMQQHASGKPAINEEVCHGRLHFHIALDQAEKVGLGTREYELKRIK